MLNIRIHIKGLLIILVLRLEYFRENYVNTMVAASRQVISNHGID